MEFEKAESHRTVVAVLLCCAQKAESLLHTSVGQRPTFARKNGFKAVSLAHHGGSSIRKAFSLDFTVRPTRRALPYAIIRKGFTLLEQCVSSNPKKFGQGFYFRIPLGMHLSVENSPPPFSHPVGMRLKEASLWDAIILLHSFLPKETSLWDVVLLKRTTPLQGFMLLRTPYVGLHPTLLTTPFQG